MFENIKRMFISQVVENQFISRYFFIEYTYTFQTGDEKLFSGMLDESGGLCLVPLVKSMREQRHPWMVEGEAQYKLAYDTVIHLLLEITDN